MVWKQTFSWMKNGSCRLSQRRAWHLLNFSARTNGDITNGWPLQCRSCGKLRRTLHYRSEFWPVCVWRLQDQHLFVSTMGAEWTLVLELPVVQAWDRWVIRSLGYSPTPPTKWRPKSTPPHRCITTQGMPPLTEHARQQRSTWPLWPNLLVACCGLFCF